MAKNKANSRKPGVSDAIYAKKSTGQKKKTNPFEIHTNREKYSVLNRQKTNDRGVPGASRAKAAKKRHETLGVELTQLHKNNKFSDRRIKDSDLKFSKEMQNRYESNSSKRKSLFNLNDDDFGAENDEPDQVLTHKGHTLKEIEQFQDVVSDDDLEDDDVEQLNSKFTEVAHFGGGDDNGDGERRSRKEMIEDLIVETKKRKAEVAKEKDMVQNMTDKLDKDWKSLIPIMGKLTRTEEERVKPDAYDRTMREMIFEARGEPTDKLKSASEIAKEEKERLEKLERDRIKRMNAEDPKKPKHRSADDLDDGYFLEENTDKDYEQNTETPEEKEESEDENEEDIEEQSSDEESGEEEESEDEDNLSDLKSNNDSSEDEDDSSNNKNKISKNLNSTKTPSKTLNELPFTFEIPSSYEELVGFLSGRSVSEQNTIIERILKCNDPKIDGSNKEKLIPFQAFLFQYINDLFDEDDLNGDTIKKSFQVLNNLVPHLFDLAQLNGIATGNLIKEILTEKQNDFKTSKNKVYPSLEVLIFLKLISNLFSTSDFKHGIVTPAFVFISQIFTRCRIKNCEDIARGLFLATIVLEYTSLSKRFLPAVIVFLKSLIQMAVVKPEETSSPSKSLLVLESKLVKSKEKVDNADLKLNSNDIIQSKISDFNENNFKIRAFNTTLLLIQEYMDLLKDNNVSYYFSIDLITSLKNMDLKMYPKKVKTTVTNVCKSLEELLENKKFTHLEFKEQPVKQLKLLEPKFDELQYNDKRKQKREEPKSKLDAMRHKVRRELKGAMREIRRDNEFVAKMRLNKQREMDRERKEKVKRIFSEASIQQSELNAIDRQNKRKKR